MPHITLPDGLPGIIGPMKAFPDTAAPLNALAEALLCKETTSFSKAERETVASYVSYLNNCVFCSESHAAVADVHWKRVGAAKEAWQSQDAAILSAKLKAMLNIAAKVQRDARSVTSQDVQSAVQLGASQADIHDVVLIAAAFCMYNRYVDGLNTFAPPRGAPAYAEIGTMLAEHGYVGSV